MRFVRLMARLAGLLVLGTVLAIGLALGLALLTTHSDVGRELVRERLETGIARALGARVRMGAFEAPRPGTVVLRDLVVSFGGQSVLRADRIEIDLGLPVPAPLSVNVRRITVDGLAGHLVRRDGHFGTIASGGGSSATRVRIDRLEVRAARVGVRLADVDPPRHAVLSDLALDAADVVHRPDGSFVIGNLDARANAGRVSGRAMFDPEHGLTADGRAQALAPHVLGSLVPGLTLPPDAAAQVSARGPWHDLRLDAAIDLATAGALDVRGRLDATVTPPSYRAAVHTTGIVPRTLHRDWPGQRLSGTARVRSRGAQLATHGHVAAGNAGYVEWRGGTVTGVQPEYRLRAHGEVRDLTHFTPGASGRFPFRLEASGPFAPSPTHPAHAWLEIGPGTVRDLTVRQARATARLDGSQIRLGTLRIEGSRLSVVGSGTIDPTRNEARANLHADLADGSRMRLVLAAKQRDSRWTGTIEELEAERADVGVWRSEAPGTFVADGGLRLDTLRLRCGSQRLALDASMSGAGRLAGTITVTDLLLAPWCTLAGTTCAGTATGAVAASGTTRAPVFVLDATARDVAVGPLQRGALAARIRHENGRAAGEVRFEGAGGYLTVAGSTPAALPGFPAPRRTDLDLQVSARRLNLMRFARWWPRMVRTADGRMRADLHVGGTWAAPRPEGTVTLRAANLELAPSGARWTDVHVVLRASGGRQVMVERLTARGGDGTLTGTGNLDFSDGLVPAAGIRLTLDRFLTVDRPILEATTTGTLRIEGPVTGPTVRGHLHVPEGTIRPAFLPASTAATEADPTIEVSGLPERPAAPPVAGLGQLTLGMTLTLGDDMRIRRRDADIQLGGTIRLERTPPEPLRVHGAVKVERGWYTFQGRRFTVRPGEVRFEGGQVGEAKLDLEATRRTGEYDVLVTIAGTVADPVLLLSSDPPLDEPDVLALLVVGRPAGELNDQERLAVQAEAAQLAVGYVVPGLTGQVGEALGVDEISVSPEQLRVSRRIGRDVFVSLSQQFIGWTGQTVGIEYEITPRLSVELSTSSQGSGAIDLFWRRRY